MSAQNFQEYVRSGVEQFWNDDITIGDAIQTQVPSSKIANATLTEA